MANTKNRMIQERITELSLLKDGWLDGYGKAPSKEGLVWLNERLTSLLPDDISVPLIFPTEEGGAALDWVKTPKYDGSLEINLETHIGAYYRLISETVAEKITDNLDLDTESNWTTVFNDIRTIERANKK